MFRNKTKGTRSLCNPKLRKIHTSHIKGGSSLFDGFTGFIRSDLKPSVMNGRGFFDDIGNFIKSTIPQVVKFTKENLPTIINKGKEIFNTGKDIISGIKKGDISGALDKGKDLFSQVKSGKDFLTDKYKEGKTIYSNVSDQIKGLLNKKKNDEKAVKSLENNILSQKTIQQNVVDKSIENNFIDKDKKQALDTIVENDNVNNIGSGLIRRVLRKRGGMTLKKLAGSGFIKA